MGFMLGLTHVVGGGETGVPKMDIFGSTRFEALEVLKFEARTSKHPIGTYTIAPGSLNCLLLVELVNPRLKPAVE